MDRPDGLLENEDLPALVAVRFSPGTQMHIDVTSQPSLIRPAVVQRHVYAKWVQSASAVGFPIAGPEMILGVTDERLLVWRPALLRSRPRRFAGALALPDIRRAAVHRRIVASVLTLLFADGTIVAVETLRASRLRTLAEAIPTYTDRRDR